LEREPPSFDNFLRLDREPDSHFGGAVENFKEIVADEATVFATGVLARRHFKAAVASLACRTDDIGRSHVPNPKFQSEASERRFPAPALHNSSHRD
jgi:hypothetical protein